MHSFPSESCHRLRDARRAKGLTQAELARRVGCQQSAISMMEAGRTTALSREIIGKIAVEVGMPLDAPDATPATGNGALPAGQPYCPDPACPSNVPFAVNGSLLFWPRPQPASDGLHCAFCGEVLVRACGRCGAPAVAGACCRLCGGAHVPPPAALDADIEAWAAARRRAIADWRALLG